MIQAPQPSEKTPDSAGEAPDPEARFEARREFLARCGRFAVVTPPAMTMLLMASSIPRDAHAASGTNLPANGQGGSTWQTILNSLQGRIPQSLLDMIASLLP
jgi:hypothetical protein